ncbi:hypothetical protein GCM10022236_05120 [Microlunatus ginsengisoli]|uniref:TNase-like domain-containing protein n=1 Tax=Microlunatus ginsengisoli TaxID=363863 RepID=A0ABP6ZFS6_9ACTN
MVAAVVVIAFVVGGYLLVGALGSSPRDPAPGRAGSAMRSATGSDTDPSSADQVPDRPKDAQPMVVRRIHDGDTVWLQATSAGPYVAGTERVKVRLIGIDTPEVQPEQCFGPEATDHLRTLIPVGSTVYVTADRDPLDRYGRRLLYLWSARGEFVNFDLVDGGWARPLRVPPNVRYAELFALAGDVARDAGTGLWGAC